MAYKLSPPECGSCKHWQPAEPRDHIGDCTRNAPALHIDDRTRTQDMRRRWPRTNSDERCGEHGFADLRTLRARRGEGGVLR